MEWNELWMSLFGTTEWLGIDMGCWVATAVSALLVIIMNVVFWTLKPKVRSEV